MAENIKILSEQMAAIIRICQVCTAAQQPNRSFHKEKGPSCLSWKQFWNGDIQLLHKYWAYWQWYAQKCAVSLFLEMTVCNAAITLRPYRANTVFRHLEYVELVTLKWRKLNQHWYFKLLSLILKGSVIHGFSTNIVATASLALVT